MGGFVLFTGGLRLSDFVHKDKHASTNMGLVFTTRFGLWSMTLKWKWGKMEVGKIEVGKMEVCACGYTHDHVAGRPPPYLCVYIYTPVLRVENAI